MVLSQTYAEPVVFPAVTEVQSSAEGNGLPIRFHVSVAPRVTVTSAPIKVPVNPIV